MSKKAKTPGERFKEWYYATYTNIGDLDGWQLVAFQRLLRKAFDAGRRYEANRIKDVRGE